MASTPPLSWLLGVAAFGCASAQPPTPAPTPALAASRPERWSGCGAPGHERCDPEPSLDMRRDYRSRACAEGCSKYWLKRAGVTAPSSQPLEVKRAWLADAEAQALTCFADCERRRADELTLNQPEPCVEGESSPNDTSCLEYSCQPYGNGKAMLPSAVREGEACEVGASKRPGTCLAGSCVPADAHVEACSALAMRATARDWLRTLEGEKLCARPGSGVSCGPRPLGSSSRTGLLQMLPCETLVGERRPAAAPWGHWPISLGEGTK